MKVGLIGLGAMGWGIAENLAKANLLTAVYNRTTDKAEQFTKQWQIPHYSSVKQLAKNVDCLFICISTDIDVLHVINEISVTMQPKSIVVDMSTVSNDTAQQAAFILSKQQVSFLDAPVSGELNKALYP